MQRRYLDSRPSAAAANSPSSFVPPLSAMATPASSVLRVYRPTSFRSKSPDFPSPSLRRLSSASRLRLADHANLVPSLDESADVHVESRDGDGGGEIVSELVREDVEDATGDGGVLAVKMELVANLDEEEDAGVVRLVPPDLLLEGVIFAAPEGWSRSTDGSSASRPRRSVPSRLARSRESLRRKASWRSGRDGGITASRAAAVTADGAGAREVISGWRGAESIDAPATGIESRRRFAAGASRWASDPTTTGVSSRVSATGGFAGWRRAKAS